MAHPELGRDILKRLYDEVADYGEIETMPKLEGRNMTMVLVPARNAPIEDFEIEEEDTTDEE
jgi:translation initiation factor IF-3